MVCSLNLIRILAYSGWRSGNRWDGGDPEIDGCGGRFDLGELVFGAGEADLES
jgi:hypothetical protein